MFTNSKADESLNNKENWVLFVQNIGFDITTSGAVREI